MQTDVVCAAAMFEDKAHSLHWLQRHCPSWKLKGGSDWQQKVFMVAPVPSLDHISLAPGEQE